MKNKYSAILATAALLVTVGAQAQHSLSVDPARQAMIQAKLHGGGHYTPTGERGANDECAGAVPLTVGTSCTPTNGDLATATQSQDPATCNTYTATEANDLWFSVVATSVGTRIEATGGPEIDPIIEVFGGDCGSLVSLGCSDATLLEETEAVTLGTTAGTTYLVRVYYWIYDSVPTDFSFTVCAFETDLPPPVAANDLCDGAVAQNLSVGSTLVYSGTTLGATDTEGFGFASTFESFTLTECANVTIDFCGMEPIFPGWTTGLGTDCPLTAVIAFSDTGSCADGNFSVTYEQVPAGTYWFAQAALDGVIEAGPYTANVTATSCIIGMDEFTAADWSLFPNPGTGVFNLQYSGKNGLANIEVMDVTGRVVYNEQAQMANGTATSLDLTGLNAGNYSVRLTVGGVRTEQRLMVK